MKKSLYSALSKPFTVLAPMEDVTDYAFREAIVRYLPRPDMFVTEFTSADGLFSKGRERVIHRLKYDDGHRPIVVQIWGARPENMFKAAQLVQEMGFDGVDINMGCPDKSVMKKGLGGATCLNPTFAKELIDAVQEGAPDLAMSVKTRLGYDRIITEEWTGFLLQHNLDALTIHGRLATVGSKDPANWEEIGKVVALRDAISPATILIGNGDVVSYAHVLELHAQYNIDGAMIGRGIFANPWVFEKTTTPSEHTPQERITLFLEHLKIYDEVWGDTKHFDAIKKFVKTYINGFDGASEIRHTVTVCKSREEMEEVLATTLTALSS